MGLAMLSIGGGFLVACLSIEVLEQDGIGPRVFPMAASAFIVALGALQITTAAPNPSRDEQGTASVWVIPALVAISVGYVIALNHVGYILATAFAAPLALLLFGVRNKMGLIAAAALCPLIYHFVFFEILGVFPPYGLWFDLLDVVEGY